jgi:hypothetical protein
VNFGNGGLGPRNGFQFLKIHAKQFAHRDVVQPNDVFFPHLKSEKQKKFMSLTQSLSLSPQMRARARSLVFTCQLQHLRRSGMKMREAGEPCS